MNPRAIEAIDELSQYVGSHFEVHNRYPDRSAVEEWIIARFPWIADNDIDMDSFMEAAHFNLSVTRHEQVAAKEFEKFVWHDIGHDNNDDDDDESVSY
jgi:hypothetical protein